MPEDTKKSEKDQELTVYLKPIKQGRGKIFWIPKNLYERIDLDWIYEVKIKKFEKIVKE
jgi:hypothetical protein